MRRPGERPATGTDTGVENGPGRRSTDRQSGAAENDDMSVKDQNGRQDKPAAAGQPDMSQDNSLIPMLVGGLVLIVVGMIFVALLA